MQSEGQQKLHQLRHQWSVISEWLQGWFLESSLVTAVATAKESLTATSKFSLMWPAQGGSQREGRAASRQATQWKAKDWEICCIALTGEGCRLSWISLFLAIQIESRVRAANNWNFLTSILWIPSSSLGKIMANIHSEIGLEEKNRSEDWLGWASPENTH